MIVFALPLLSACHSDETPKDTSVTGYDGTFTGGGFLVGQFCDVQSVFQSSCVVGCHSGLVPKGGLDLQTDPYGALVGVTSQINSASLLVEPGYPGHSLLYRKITGKQGANEGDSMPPGQVLDSFLVTPIVQWIQDGAKDDCDEGATPPPPTTTTDPPTYGGKHHPPGWEAPDVHGTAAKLQTDGDCRSCHGSDLGGGSVGVSCDDCHDAGWRTNCTFCHGGGSDSTGAPPRDIDGETNLAQISFPPHHQHVTDTADHAAFKCTECHVKPTDVLSPGHVFGDLTAGFGEVDYSSGLSAYGTYLQGSCTNLYCHGNGQGDTGSANADDGAKTCTSCHPDATSPKAKWGEMSGQHELHLDSVGARCIECHSTVVDANEKILDPALHVNGHPDVVSTGAVWDGSSCTGSCHGHNHDQAGW